MTKKSVTMSDIAKVMNVSTVTVSKALGDRDGVSVELRERIKQKATEMGYRVHAGSHGAKDGLTYNIGIIVAKHFISDASSFYWIVYRNIVELLQNQNYYGMLEVVDNKSMTDPNAVEEVPNTVLDHKVDGLIVLGQLSEDYIDRLMQHRIPLRHDWVIADRSNESDIFPEFTLPNDMPTAFVCNCDETAYKLVNQLKAAGYSIPDDISVVGYDNHIYSTICNPRLTTIDVNSRVMSTEAVDIILHKIRDGNYRRGRTLVTGKLVRRGSVKNLNEA